MDLLEKTSTILDIVLKQPKLQPFLTSVNIILIDPTVELILESANVAELRSIARTILARFFKKEETLEEKVLAIGELHDNLLESNCRKIKKERRRPPCRLRSGKVTDG